MAERQRPWPWAAAQAVALDSAEGWARWCGAHPGARCRLLAGGRLMHPLLVPPDLPVPDRGLGDYVRGVFAHYLGAAAQGPVLAWHQGRQRGAALWQGPPVAALQASARAHGVRLLAVQPLWWWQWRRALARQPALAGAASAHLLVIEGDALTHLGLQSGQLKTLRQQRLDAARADALAQWCRAEALPGPVWAIGHGLAGRVDSPPYQALGRLDAEAPELSPPCAANPLSADPDLLDGPARRAAGWGWALAGTAALALLAAGLEAQQAWQALQQARSVTLAAPTAAAARAAPPAAAAELQRLQALLAHPWGAVFAGVESASLEGVQWQGLEQAAGQPALRLTALVADDAAALRLADRLAAQPGWRDVMPTRLRPLERGAGVAVDLQAQFGATASAAR